MFVRTQRLLPIRYRFVAVQEAYSAEQRERDEDWQATHAADGPNAGRRRRWKPLAAAGGFVLFLVAAAASGRLHRRGAPGRASVLLLLASLVGLAVGTVAVLSLYARSRGDHRNAARFGAPLWRSAFGRVFFARAGSGRTPGAARGGG